MAGKIGTCSDANPLHSLAIVSTPLPDVEGAGLQTFLAVISMSSR